MRGPNSIQKMRIGLTVLVVTCLVAVVGYVLAGWSYLDALYMVVITIFGVGYGEVRPVTDPALKIFTLMVIVTGCSSGIYVLGGFVQMIAEGEIRRVIGAQRMSKGISKLSGHAIVCGLGRVGRGLVHELKESGIDVVVIDRSTEILSECEYDDIKLIAGDASKEETLVEAGIERAAVLATVLPADAENVFVSLTARGLSGTVRIIARCESERTKGKLIRSGANRVVMPTMIGASQIAHLIACPTAEKLVEDQNALSRMKQDLEVMGLKLHEVKVDKKSHLLGKSIRHLELQGDRRNLIVAIQNPCGRIEWHPKSDHRVGLDDKLVILSQGSVVRQCDALKPAGSDSIDVAAFAVTDLVGTGTNVVDQPIS